MILVKWKKKKRKDFEDILQPFFQSILKILK